jgi:hypothetical protein
VSLSFEADLTITGTNSTVEVSDDGAGTLVVTTSELRSVVEALRSDGLLPSGTLRTVSDRLADAGGTVRLRTPTTALVTLGSDAEPTVLTRIVGLRHVRIQSVRGLIVAMRPPLRSALPAVAAGGSVVAFIVRRRVARRHQRP